MHFTDGRRHFRHRPDLFDNETMGQESLIDQFDHTLVALPGPDGSIMTAADVHELLECDQDPCKARAEINSASPAMLNYRLLLLAGFLVVGAIVLGFRDIDWFLLKKSLRQRFPKVEWISTTELAAWMSDHGRRTPLLLDVRTSEEWEVSHLAGARRVEPNAPVETAIAGVAKDTPIVTYCAVGYRSGEMATRLRAAGFTNVHNLEGSIFAWANEHRLLVHGDDPVKTVHPYNAFWGRLLRDEARAPLGK